VVREHESRAYSVEGEPGFFMLESNLWLLVQIIPGIATASRVFPPIFRLFTEVD
jgi:hypothetical protein